MINSKPNHKTGDGFLLKILSYILCFFIVYSCAKQEINKEPLIRTDKNYHISGENVFVSANIIDVGNGISNYGHCWSELSGATIDNNKSEFGPTDTIGVFTSILSELKAATTYYIRSYCMDEMSIVYGDEIIIRTFDPTLPDVSTGIKISSDTSGIIFQGTINSLGLGSDSLISYGHCWAAGKEPTILDEHTDLGAKIDTGSYKSMIKGLKPNTGYYVRAYARNSLGLQYGAIEYFRSSPLPPEVMIKDVYFSQGRLIVNCDIKGNGDPFIDLWLCWNKNGNPTISEDSVKIEYPPTEGTKDYLRIDPTLFDCDERYYFKLYAKNSIGGVYSNSKGAEKSSYYHPFLELGGPYRNEIDQLMLRLNGNFPLCPQEYMELKLCYSSNPSPTLLDNVISIEPEVFEYQFTNEIDISNFEPGKYYFRMCLLTDTVQIYSTEICHIIAPLHINMKHVKSSTFNQGNNDYPGSGPEHSVFVDPFMAAYYEVTNELYVNFLNANNIPSDGTLDGLQYIDIVNNPEISFTGSTFVTSDPQLPVSYVSWHGAQSFCSWIGGRLPSESEWEYLGKGGLYGSGDTYAGGSYLSPIAWYANNSGGRKHAVGNVKYTFLSDLSGNVREWCSDWYDEDYYTVSPTDNPSGPQTGTYKVVRGGSYLTDEGPCRIYARDYENPDSCYPDVGFRVVIPFDDYE